MVAEDRSLETMVKEDRFSYMSGLVSLRNYLAGIRWDMSRRDWVGKNVDSHGFLHIAPENFHSREVEDILRYCLTIDIEEMEAASREGLDEPRFQLIPADVLVMIDSLWSYFALHPAFHALKIYRDIYVDGKRYPVPEVKASPRIKMGGRRYLYVGDLMSDAYLYCGLRDPQLELFCETCYEDMFVVKKGRQYLNVSTEDHLTVNDEGLWFLFQHELDRLISGWHDNPAYVRTSGFMWYLTAGIISIGKGQHSRADMVLRRSRLRESKGLIWPYEGFNFDQDTLSVSDYSRITGDMPADIEEGATIPLF